MANLPMRHAATPARMWTWAICLGILCTVVKAGAVSVQDLLDQKDITPEGFARMFADFSFELAPMQDPENFLKRKRGDCADFSNLASTVLKQHGYTTKLVVVMMAKDTHVVCYVKEAGGFLDYNHRADAQPVIPSDGTLEDIAGKVSGDFHSHWRMASAFRYRGTKPVYLDTVFPVDPSLAASKAHKDRVAKTAKATPPAKVSNPAMEATVLPIVLSSRN